MAELHLYDFDGTLFRSPDPPSDWTAGKKWFIDSQSLNPPCVPLKPGDQWWIGSTVAEARHSIADPDVWAIVCTGRPDKLGGFNFRIRELLRTKGLGFDEVYLNPGGASTVEYKKAVITKILRRFPHITIVHVWEDEATNLEHYMSHVARLGRTGIPHLVREVSRGCESEQVREIAARYNLRKAAAGTQADIDRTLPDFKRNYTELKDGIARAKAEGFSDYGAMTITIGPWSTLHRRLGHVLVRAILAVKEIPKGYAKKMELAARLFLGNPRIPKDIFTFFEKNQKHYELLITAAETWPAKTEGGEALFTVGPFRVHNTVGLAGDELETLKNAIEKAVTLIRQVQVPGIERVLYGDVHIVGRLLQTKTLAWYYPKDDSLYVRPIRKIGRGEVHNIIHELGHRFWSKFASLEQKKAWTSHHIRLETKSPDVRAPNPGEILPFKVHRTVNPVIKNISNGKYLVDVDLGQGETFEVGVPISTVLNALYKNNKVLNFPTPYSAKSMEEHFCEALALKALKQLPDDHEKMFDPIWT